MRVLGITNQKGGVGKTTTVVALGGLLAEQGQRVLLIDLDPQASLTRYFDLDPDSGDGNSAGLFQSPAPNSETMAHWCVETGEANLYVMPGTPELASIERRKAQEPGLGMAVKHAVKNLENLFDWVLIDSPPTLGLLMVNVLAASEQLLLPSQTEPLALEGLERMVRTLGMVKNSRGQAPEYLIIPTLHDKRTRAGRDCLAQLREKYHTHLWRSAVPVDTQLREASRQHISPARITEPSRGTEAYRLLLDDLMTGQAQVESPNKPGAWMAV